MSQKPKNAKVVIDGDEPRRGADGFEQARPAAEASEDRRAAIDSAAKDFMSRNAKLLRRLAE